ncbi:MAG: hypothetical protein CMA54_03760 [Euryarchaeota archaeon]|nr:hypothetical protein [Euryarchaeota archaeon]
MYCLPSIVGSNPESPSAMPDVSELLSNGSEATNGPKLATIMVVMSNKDSGTGAVSALSRMNNTPSEYLRQSVRGRILTSMEHRSYMRGRGRSILLAAFLLVMSLVMPVDAIDSNELVVERELVLIATIPHDPTAFTQGLEVQGDLILESTGLYGHSGLRELDSSTGEVLREVTVDGAYFGEGITIFESSVIMLTWKGGRAFVFDLGTLSPISNHSYEGEGWGICFDGQYLVMSNGSSELAFRDPHTFEVIRSVTVISNDDEVSRLNELECVGSTVYANVWGQDRIIAINATSGVVEFYVSASSLAANQGETKNEVLNGIAYDQTADAFWITGKNWTEMYLVSFESNSSDDQNASTGIEGQRTSTALPLGEYFILGIFILLTILFVRRLKHQQPSPPSVEEQSLEMP